MPSRTNTRKRLERFANSTKSTKSPSTLFSKKKLSRERRRPKRQTIRPRRKKRKSKMTRFWRDRRYDKIKL